MHYQKMAGTAAVFVRADKHANKPVECQGPNWNDRELKLYTLPRQLASKAPMATNLALEGLETYDPPAHGDVRTVTALATQFVYVGPIRGWVEWVTSESGASAVG